MAASINSETALKIGTRVQGGEYTYTVEDIIGQGGFGITYKVSAMTKTGKIEHKNYFALKELFVDDYCERDHDTNSVRFSTSRRATAENSKKDFLAEARRLNSLDHPNIVAVNEVFEANDTAYYVMEYLTGDSLRRYIEQNEGPLSQEQTLTLFTPILNAVNYLHANHLTHLDIKPDNIMLKPGENGELTPVLIDFGLSKHYDDKGKATSTIRMSGLSHGYAPTEQYEGITTFTPQADIYAIAATMLYCVTGNDPVRASQASEQWIKSALAAKVDDTFAEAVCHAMRIMKAERTASVSDFAKELGVKLTAVSSSVSGFGGKKPKKPKKKKENKDTEVIDPNKPARPRWLLPLLIGLGILVVGVLTVFLLNPFDPAPDPKDLSDLKDSIVSNDTIVAPVAPVTPAAPVAPAVEVVDASVDDGYSVAYAGALNLYNSRKYSDCKRECQKLLRQYTSREQKQQLNQLIEYCDTALAAEETAQQQASQQQPTQQAAPAPTTTPAATPATTSGSYSSSATAAQRAAIDELLGNMVWVAGGTFTMGAPDSDSEAFDWEKPAHSETVGGFYLCKYEVTQRLWSAVMGNNPSNWKGDNLPVECVSWNDCQTFINKLNELTNNKYGFRLPTEAEWEYAARGGSRSRGYKYSGSDNLGSVAWYDGNSGNKTHAVGGKSPNELGLYDMSGNVWEWTSSKWCSDYSSPRNSSDRVNRGGSWNYYARFCRVSYRDYYDPGYRLNCLGLRLARRP